MTLGAHVDQTHPIAGARARGVNLVQIFLGDPQAWRAPHLKYAGGAEGLRRDAAEAGVDLYVHAPYVINVATVNNRVRIPSRKLLQQTLVLADQIGAKAVIVHGGQVGPEDAVEIGFDNWRKCIASLCLDVPLFIENTAGGQSAMARHLERIAPLWAAISTAPDADRVGFCLDTCHAHAAGLELVGLTDRIRAVTGRIDLVHANDSRDAFNSGADRHQNLGQGRCDPEGLADVFRTCESPLLVETPGGVDAHLRDLRWIADRQAVEV